MGNYNKINVGSIIKHHFATLVNDNSKKSEFDDWFTFLVTPILLASLITYLKPHVSPDIVNIIITTLSIFVGLLINVIVLIFDIIKRDAEKKLKNSLLKETLSNISYTILISILTILFSLLTFIEINVVCEITSFVVYFFLSHFILTLLMIIKRMYSLFINEIEEIENHNSNSEE